MKNNEGIKVNILIYQGLKSAAIILTNYFDTVTSHNIIGFP